MIKITEIKKNNSSVFEIQYFNSDNKLTSSQIINYKTYSLPTKQNNTTYMLYDSNMVPVSNVFNFINGEMSSQPDTSKEKALYALKFLYCYSELMGCDIANLSQTDINNLKYFLEGVSPKTGNMELDLITHRSKETCNGYLSVYRNYLSFLGCSNSYLFDILHNKSRSFISTSEVEVTKSRYKASEKNYTPENEIPKYISVEEFRNILHIVRDKYGIREECIIRLMFQCGLRIGEVLGLTLDDLIVEKINDKYIPVAYIRNRVSDKYYQHAKTCMHPRTIKDYKLKDYGKKGYGFQMVILSEDIYQLINSYIDYSHDLARKTNLDKYNKYCKADRTRKTELGEDDNYYVFLNTIQKPLSIDIWNKTMREIFKEANLQIDVNTRENNLNHRFRHGFAMFHVKYLNTPMLELQKKMRHKSLSSVFKYYNPTIDDEIEIKNGFIEDLYTIIPELRMV